MKARGELAIELAGNGRQPVFLEIASSIIREIERGRLKPGDALPGTRALASSLEVHRNTVDAAFHELTMQGWLVTQPSRGTFVASDLPEIRSSHRKPLRTGRGREPTGKAMPPSLSVSDGVPDPRVMPRSGLARAFRNALSAPAFLSNGSYGDPRGAMPLRTALADYLVQERGLTVTPDDVLVTRGSQMGLFLAAAAILQPGQTIAVEDPGYPLAWAAFRAAGARVAGVPVDAQGIDIGKLATLAQREPALKAVYVTPHHQYPTTVTLGAARRLKLLDLARHHRLTIIEDDYDHEYRFDGRPILPLAARSDANAAVIYISSLSKLLAPAVRVGYTVALPEILARMADRREAIDRQGDLPLEQALASLIEDGELRRHARKARRLYAARRDFLANEITLGLGEDVAFDLPAGGLAIWLRLGPGGNSETWSSNAGRAGLSIAPGLRFALDPAKAPQAFRIGYANLDETALKRVVAMLVRSRPRR